MTQRLTAGTYWQTSARVQTAIDLKTVPSIGPQRAGHLILVSDQGDLVFISCIVKFNCRFSGFLQLLLLCPAFLLASQGL